MSNICNKIVWIWNNPIWQVKDSRSTRPWWMKSASNERMRSKDFSPLCSAFYKYLLSSKVFFWCNLNVVAGTVVWKQRDVHCCPKAFFHILEFSRRSFHFWKGISGGQPTCLLRKDLSPDLYKIHIKLEAKKPTMKYKSYKTDENSIVVNLNNYWETTHETYFLPANFRC